MENNFKRVEHSIMETKNPLSEMIRRSKNEDMTNSNQSLEEIGPKNLFEKVVRPHLISDMGWMYDMAEKQYVKRAILSVSAEDFYIKRIVENGLTIDFEKNENNVYANIYVPENSENESMLGTLTRLKATRKCLKDAWIAKQKKKAFAFFSLASVPELGITEKVFKGTCVSNNDERICAQYIPCFFENHDQLEVSVPLGDSLTLEITRKSSTSTPVTKIYMPNETDEFLQEKEKILGENLDLQKLAKAALML